MKVDRYFQWLAICGIAGPIVYAVVLVALGALQPGYSHMRQAMSELGAVGAPHALGMNIAGFSLLGLSLIAFALGLHRGLRPGRLGALAPALIGVSGLSLIMTGIFHCDPG